MHEVVVVLATAIAGAAASNAATAAARLRGLMMVAREIALTFLSKCWQPSYLTPCETSSFAPPAHAEFAFFSELLSVYRRQTRKL